MIVIPITTVNAKRVGLSPRIGALISSIKLVNGFKYAKYWFGPKRSGFQMIGVIKKASCIIVAMICCTSRKREQTIPSTIEVKNALIAISSNPIGSQSNIIVAPASLIGIEIKTNGN